MEALPGGQKGCSGLAASSAKKPAAGRLWTEVEGREEPHTTAHLIRAPPAQHSEQCRGAVRWGRGQMTVRPGAPASHGRNTALQWAQRRASTTALEAPGLSSLP